MDRLSNLPDHILCHILSFLPTKTSVACSILSKRWELLWTSVPVLDLDIDRDMPRQPWAYKFFNDKEKDEFLVIVDNILLLHRESPIKKLRLHCRQGHKPGVAEDYLREWVLAGSLEELDLACCDVHFTFPRSSGNYNNMLLLKLSGRVLFSVESCLFPKLKVLHLVWACFSDRGGSSLKNFLSACPVLEELVCKELFGYGFKICVPTLTSLVLQCGDDYGHRSNSEFLLETPALEYLTVKLEACLDSLVTENLCNLRKADIKCLVLDEENGSNLCESYGSRVMKLLTKLSCVKFLKLSCKKMTNDCHRWINPWRGLVDGYDYTLLNELPVFDNLVSLELCIPSCDCVLLPHLLQKFHNLKHIGINKVFDIEEAEVGWKEPLQVPICLSSTLSSFCFQGFEGFKVEVELVKYVTKHAKVLKNMTLKTSYFRAFEARAEAMLLRGSEHCHFHIT